MAQIVWDGVRHVYNTTIERGDPRVADWPLMQSPLPTLGICLSYVYLVKYLGPTLMKGREPMNIRYIMIIYNFAMVIVSIYIFMKLGIYGWFGKYNYRCQPVDYSNSIEAIGMAHLAWWYFISKFGEFCDTIFFVLRKKYSHVSTLHVIHHGVMPMSVWWGVKFTPGGHSTFFAFVNSFVHILMYIYYGMSAVGPHMTKYLWWKKYMTTIQMVQFVMIFVHSFQLLFRECHYPRGFMWWIGFHAVLFWFLFWEFYKAAYRSHAAKSKSSQNNNKPLNGSAATANSDAQNGITEPPFLTMMCSLDYDQLQNGYKRLVKTQNGTVQHNGTVKQNGTVKLNGAAKQNGTSGRGSDDPNVCRERVTEDRCRK